MAPRILIVDDRVENLIAMEAILRDLDAELVRASSGEEALACLLDGEVALILMDVMMPGLDGFETATLIRGRRDLRRIPIIFVTAISREQRHVFRGYESGAVDYLFKPLEALVVTSKVQVFLELYRYQKELEEKNAALEQQNELLRLFAGAASHDLRAPLRTITSFSQMLATSLGDSLDPTPARYLEFLLKAGTRMQALIDDLLEYARLGHHSEPPARVPLADVLRDAREDLTTQLDETGASLVVGELPEVVGHPHQLRRLFENLIVNSLKYRSEAAPAVEISCQRSESVWVIRVQDNGLGIEPRFQQQIFEPFKRLHGARTHEGSGIGLASCRRIAERHGGSIHCESGGKGLGSTFVVRLPALVHLASTRA